MRGWLSSVENFSYQSLSVSSDKLSAMASLASKLQSNLGSEYAAGLWNNEMLPLQLAWTRKYPIDMGLKPAVCPGYRAPTYSWASMDGAISMHLNPKTEERLSEIDILSLHAELAGSYPFGEVNGGCVQVKGQNLRGILSYTGEGYHTVCFTERDEELSFAPDTILVPEEVASRTGEPEYTARRSTSLVEPQPFSVPVHLLRLVSWPTTTAVEKNDFLVLGRSSRQREAFERLGLASADLRYKVIDIFYTYSRS